MGSWFQKNRGDRRPGLEPGAIFRKARTGNFVETARVLSVTPEAVGIPHVRFQVILDTPGHAPLIEGYRILCLSAFTEQFPERVPV